MELHYSGSVHTNVNEVTFGPESTNWASNPEYNRIFIKTQENYMNDLLRHRGHLFLNEVYDSLGVPRTREGAVLGWVWEDNSSRIVYDVTEVHIKGTATKFIIDFNVDGVILDRI